MPAAWTIFPTPRCTCWPRSATTPLRGAPGSTASAFARSNGTTSRNGARIATGSGDAWFGFERVRALEGLPEDIALVPLIGHTFGHAGVAIRRGGGWLLQAGDAYFFHREMDPQRPYCTPGLRFYQWMMEKERPARLGNQRRLRELVAAHGGEVEVMCGHDPFEFERCAGRPLRTPAERVVERRARPRLVASG